MKNSVVVSFSYIAAVIGAGFASGAEIISYFLKYGRISFFGVLISGILFGLLSFFVLKICIRENVTEFYDFLRLVMPKSIVRLSDVMVSIFMVVTLSAMSSGASEILNAMFCINKLLGASIFSVVCGLILMMPISKITKINGILGVVISIGVVLSCFYIINFRFYEKVPAFGNFIVSAATYTSYNVSASLVLLCKMSSIIKSEKEAKTVGIISGAGIFSILIFLWCAVGIYYGKVDLGEVPMLFIARRQNSVFSAFYGVILFFAILSTAISNGFGVKQFLEKNTGSVFAVVLIVILMIILSFMGFSRIVDTGYRFCGIILMLIPVFILKKSVISRITEKKRDN